MEPRTQFFVVECECGTQQTVFSNAASVVKCQKCGSVLAEPRGGKAKLTPKTKKVKVF